MRDSITYIFFSSQSGAVVPTSGLILSSDDMDSSEPFFEVPWLCLN